MKPEPDPSDDVQAHLRERFGFRRIAVRCARKAAADIDIVDPAARSDEATAERIARAVWDYAGMRLDLKTIIVTISPRELGDHELMEMFVFGRSLLFQWGLQGLDQTRP